MAYSNSQVAHEFAHRTGKKQIGSNMFYDINSNGTATIYSYGYHFAIAHIVDENTVLLTDETYSISTLKHVYKVWDAISHFDNIIHVPFNLTHYYSRGVELNDSHINSIQHYENEIDDFRLKHLRARKRSYISEIKTSIAKLKEFVEFFGCANLVDDIHSKFISSEYSITDEAILLHYFNTDERELLREKEERSKKQEEERKKAEAKKLSESIEKFRNRELDYVYNTSFTYLRYNDSKNVLETSKGMIVEINKQLSTLYDMMKNGKELKEPITVEGFRVDSVTPKFIKIGCHTISVDEADRVAQYITQ